MIRTFLEYTAKYSFHASAALLTLLPSSQQAAQLEPTSEMAAQTRWVVNTINSRHFLKENVEKLDGEEMVEAYIASFDFGKMQFIRPEIDDFNFRFAGAMEDFLEKGNLYAAFNIYQNFSDQVTARTDWVNTRLDEDFDFTIDETFAPDRRDEQWPADKETADALWEQRLKYELLNEMLSLASEYKEPEGEDSKEKAEKTVKKNTSSSLDPVNPDIYEDIEEEDKFDPSKVQRLLSDNVFRDQMLDEARKKIRRRYERNLLIVQDREAAEVQESFINSMTQLFDPHSSFLSADTLEGFNSAVQNSFVGIGALLQDDDGVCTIKQVLPGGPAEESRLLHDEDQILGVAQGPDGEFEDVIDMQLRYIVRKIKGEKGTVVRLLIRPGDASDPSIRKDISIVRGEVKLTANLASAKLISVPITDSETVAVGVIELPSFYGNIGAGDTLTTTTDDVTELINKLKLAQAKGIILDLRMNGGGLLTEAVRLTGLFIPVGPVVQVLDNQGRADVLSDRDPTIGWDGPLIVLTSRFSASASEIVAGALQDHDRALIVGNSSTHGKGTVQEVYNMNSRSSFSFFQKRQPMTRPVASKITIKQFYLPDGSSTQLKGVPSDIILPSVNEFLPIGESDLDHALPWDKTQEVDWINDWDKLNIASPQDPTLRSNLLASSKKRQESLPEFNFLKQQIDWRHKRFEEKKISLNLKQRITKKIKDQAYVEQLDETYDKLSETDYEMEEILLEITKEQEALSKKNLAEPDPTAIAIEVTTEGIDKADETSKGEEEDEPFYDIYLRESARIMADWISALPDNSTARTTPKIIQGNL